MIMVYFVNGCKAPFERDKLAFKDRDAFFTLSDSFQEEPSYAKLVENDRVFVNFDNVCYVREEDVRSDAEYQD